jgi:hypothetical protein
MKTKLGKRKTRRKLLLEWNEQEEQFAIAVTVRPPTSPRFLKPGKVSIDLNYPLLYASNSSLFRGD